MRSFVFILLACGVLFAIAISVHLSSASELERRVAQSSGKKIRLLGNTFSNVVTILGEPNTIDQLDGGHTFFYWPLHGVGAFCHPLFKGQNAFQNRSEWIITSVWVPLKTDLQQHVVKQEGGAIIHFEKTLFTISEGEKIVAGGNVTPHMRNGVLEAFEIQKRDAFFDYD